MTLPARFPYSVGHEGMPFILLSAFFALKSEFLVPGSDREENLFTFKLVSIAEGSLLNLKLRLRQNGEKLDQWLFCYLACFFFES